MSVIQNILVTLSFLCWFGVSIVEFLRRKKRNVTSLTLQLLIMLAAVVILNRYFGYFETKEFKGGVTIGEGWVLCGLYLSTILGILGHHLFVQIKDLHEKGRQRKIKWMPVVKPLIISPIIFLAVLNQLEQISAQANTLKIIITQCILAFQNGFFWKTVIEQFENKHAEEKKS